LCVYLLLHFPSCLLNDMGFWPASERVMIKQWWWVTSLPFATWMSLCVALA